MTSQTGGGDTGGAERMDPATDTFVAHRNL